MKKFLTATAASLLLFGGQVEATTLVDLPAPGIETRETGKWAHFRDKHILGNETENERNDRKDWERQHRHDDSGHYRYDYPPPRHGHDYPPPPRRR